MEKNRLKLWIMKWAHPHFQFQNKPKNGHIWGQMCSDQTQKGKDASLILKQTK